MSIVIFLLCWQILLLLEAMTTAEALAAVHNVEEISVTQRNVRASVTNMVLFPQIIC